MAMHDNAVLNIPFSFLVKIFVGVLSFMCLCAPPFLSSPPLVEGSGCCTSLEPVCTHSEKVKLYRIIFVSLLSSPLLCPLKFANFVVLFESAKNHMDRKINPVTLGPPLTI